MTMIMMTRMMMMMFMMKIIIITLQPTEYMKIALALKLKSHKNQMMFRVNMLKLKHTP